MNDKMANWNALPDLEEVAEISVEDEACLEEIRQVLERHRKVHLFGISLLHKHFELDEDEILMEYSDPAAKSLSIRPVKLAELEGKAYRPTAWRIEDGKIQPIGACASGMYGGHYGYKD